MKFELRDINSWRAGLYCTPTALAAITGKTPDEIGVLLKQAAEINGRDISEALLPGYNINDWLKVIKLIGGDWIQAENYDDRPYKKRPTINQWMASTMGPDLELVFCDDGANTGHVFATMEQEVVDTYTDGKRVPFKKVPPQYEMLRVKRVFLVFIEENSAPPC